MSSMSFQSLRNMRNMIQILVFISILLFQGFVSPFILHAYEKVITTNNATSRIAITISAAATSITLNPGTGALFPDPTAADGTYAPATLYDASDNKEIVYITERVGDILTVERGKEGTTPREWPVGTGIGCRLTSSIIEDKLRNPIDHVYYVNVLAADQSAVGVAGSLDDYSLADINEYLDSSGTTGHVVLPAKSTAYTLTGNITLTANMTLHIHNGAVFETDGNILTFDASVYIDAGSYRIFDTTSGEVIIETGPINFAWFGGATGGDSADLLAAFMAADGEEGFTWFGPSPSTWTIDATVDVGVIGDHTVLDFRGMTFSGTLNANWIVLNDDATLRPREVTVIGGTFEWGDGTAIAAAAVAIRIDGAVDLIMEQSEYRFFASGIEGERWESPDFRNNWFWSCTIGIYENFLGTVIGTGVSSSQKISIHHNQFGMSQTLSGTNAVKLNGPARSVRIFENTSGGDLTNSIYRVVDSDGTGSVALIAHSVTVSDNRAEQLECPFLIVSHNGTNVGLSGLVVRDNRISSSDATAEVFSVFKLDYIRGGIIEGNDIAMAASDTITLLELADANTTSLTVDFESGYVDWSGIDTPLTSSSSRTALHVRPDIRVSYKDNGSVTGFEGDVFSTTTGTVDMSVAWSGWSTHTHGIPPVGYFIRVEFTESGGDGAVRLEDVVGTSNVYSFYMAVAPIIDDNAPPGTALDTTMHVGYGIVYADSAGDIYYAITASGVGTATIRITVLEVIQSAWN